MYKTQILKIEQLERFEFRDIRQDLLNKLEERIEKTGYNPSRPLTVIQQGDSFLVADGNHRLETCKKLGIKDIPCIVYSNSSDPFSLASKCNQDEDTYAPMDLFDWLKAIKALKEQKVTQKEIGEKFGVCRTTISAIKNNRSWKYVKI